jgi:hypothetical protein
MTALPKISLRHFVLVVFLIVCVAGVETADANLVIYLREIIANGKPVLPPTDGFLLEGLLQDAVGVGFTFALPHSATSIQLAWAIGLFCAAGALAFSIWDRSIDVTVAFLAVAFTRIVDTCFLWIGKLDPFLFTFLILTVNRRPWVATLAGGLAAFCHPTAAVISTLGVNAITYWTERRVNWLQVAATIVCAAADIVIVKHVFPSVSTRTDLFGTQAWLLIDNGVEYGIWGAVIGIVLPVLAALCFLRSKPIKLDLGSAPALLWLVGAFLIAAMVTLDHTRVATLLVFVPFLAWLNHAFRSSEAAGAPLPLQLFGALFLTRLFVPHVAMEGAKIFEYEQVLRMISGVLHR